MGHIKVVEQTYEYECGICVLNSMHNYFYPEVKLNKQQIISYAKLTNMGLSLYELKKLGERINLSVELYELNFEDFLDLNYFDYFISCIKNKLNSNHYVICKREKNYFVIYDSNKKVSKLSYEEFKNVFTNIFVKVDKKLVNDYNLSNYQSNKQIFFEYLNLYWLSALIIFVELLSLFLSVIVNSFIKILIDVVFLLKLKIEIFYFGLFFITTQMINFLLNYLMSLMKLNKLNNLFNSHLVTYTNILKNKKLQFFDKFSLEVIYGYPNAIYSVLSVKYFLLPVFIANAIEVLILTFIVVFNSYLFIIPIVINVIFIVLFGFIKYKNSYDNFEKLNIDKNKIEIIHNQFVQFMVNEKNQSKLKEIEEKIHKEVFNYQQINKNYNVNNLTIDLYDSSITKIIFIIFTFLISYLVINNSVHNIGISEIIFVTSIINMLNNAVNEGFNFLCSLSLHKKNKNLISDLENIDNKFIYTSGLNLKKVHQITFSNLSFCYGEKVIFKDLNLVLKNGYLIRGKNGVGKTTLFKIIALFFENNTNWSINKIGIHQYNLTFLEQNIIYINSESNYDFVNCENLFNDYQTTTLFQKILVSTKLDIHKNNFSDGERQWINLLNTLNYKNKIILFDEALNSISTDYDELIYGEIKNHLEKNNFVLWISHNKRINKYFKKVVNLSESS